MGDPRIACINVVLKECFWGEHDLTAQDILERIDKNELGFNRFLFSKIMENSHYPSRHLRNLFAPDVLEELLKQYLKTARNENASVLLPPIYPEIMIR